MQLFHALDVQQISTHVLQTFFNIEFGRKQVSQLPRFVPPLVEGDALFLEIGFQFAEFFEFEASICTLGPTFEDESPDLLAAPDLVIVADLVVLGPEGHEEEGLLRLMEEIRHSIVMIIHR